MTVWQKMKGQCCQESLSTFLLVWAVESTACHSEAQRTVKVISLEDVSHSCPSLFPSPSISMPLTFHVLLSYHIVWYARYPKAALQVGVATLNGHHTCTLLSPSQTVLYLSGWLLLFISAEGGKPVAHRQSFHLWHICKMQN